jgi:hypothetical protein
MAKLTLDTITSSFASTTLFNTNFATILAELDGKVLYRNNTSGEANQMENDLDMNSNSILNANAINTTSLTVNGLPVAGGNVTAAAVTYDDSASVHTAVDVQEALDELGNASLATIQTSATDATAGRLMAVGAGGLLSNSLEIATELNDYRTTKLLRVEATTTYGAVATGKAGYVLHVERNIASGAIRAQQDISYVDGSKATRERDSSDTWSTWQSIDPQAFGLGLESVGLQVPSDDCNAVVSTGFYYVQNGTTNSPLTGTLGGVLIHEIRSSGSATLRYAQTVKGGGEHYERENVGGTWTAWQPVYTGANYQPDSSAFGIGVVRLMRNVSGGNIANDASVAGANLKAIYFNASLAMVESGTAVVGTWKSVGNTGSMPDDFVSYYVRTA